MFFLMKIVSFQTVYFKLRRMIPCALCGLNFKIALPEQDEVQFSVVGMALGLRELTKGDKLIGKVGLSLSKDPIAKSGKLLVFYVALKKI